MAKIGVITEIMKRRDFFKVVMGFVAGVFATSVEGKKRSGTRLATKEEIVAAQKAANPPYILLDDSKMIQEVIDLAAKGGGVVYFPKGTYNLKYGIIV